MYARKDETWSERTAVSKYNLARRAPSRPSGSRDLSAQATRGVAGPRSGQSGGPRSCASTAHSAGSRAECESAPARRHTPPAFSTVGFVACLQKKLTKPHSTHPARRGRRESGVRGVGSHYADRYHDGMMVCHHTGLTISGLTNLLVRSGVCTRPLRRRQRFVVLDDRERIPEGARAAEALRADRGGCAACTRGMQNGPVTNSNTRFPTDKRSPTRSTAHHTSTAVRCRAAGARAASESHRDRTRNASRQASPSY